MGNENNSYDTAASGEVQAVIKRLAGQIEATLSQHEANVKQTFSGVVASGVKENYLATEGRYKKAADDTLKVVQMLLKTMGDNDATAADTLRKAQAAVDRIGS
jgi:hypothetical protein